MSIGDLVAPPTLKAADALLSGLMSKPWGQVSPSVYETGRLVTLAPWLIGHAERVEFLVGSQRRDGGWGAPGGYGLVPTLSATEAILTVLRRGDRGVFRSGALAEVADRGLGLLSRWLGGDLGPALPDMPAVELIVPYLIELINDHQDDHLPLPRGMSTAPLAVIRNRLSSGAEVPEKLLHALEIAGGAAAGAAAVRAEPIGTVGASPAATAAWLGERGLLDPGNPARVHLEAVVRRYGGPVPVGLPITVFERGWVLSWLARAGIPVDVPPEMLADLSAAIGPAGSPAGPGLPSDADTTSVALYALGLLGMPYEPESLWAYETETHFCTWLGEQGSSVSTNAHVLDSFGQYARSAPQAERRYRAAMAKVAAWLRSRQRPDGSWADRWHASPMYATACVALALHEFGGDSSAEAVGRAVRWLVASQRADGSWGRWGGTAEETAYALQALLLIGSGNEAVARGYGYLLRAGDVAAGPPLWHDKDLYLPVAIVEAAVLAACYLAQRNDTVVMLCDRM